MSQPLNRVLPHHSPACQTGNLSINTQGGNLFNLALDAMLIADDQGRYVEVNPAACRLLGLPQEQVLGHTLADFCQPSSANDLQQQWQQFLQQGYLETEICLTISCDRTPRIIQAVTTAHISPNRHLCIWRDITVTVQLTQQLSQQAEAQSRELQALRTQLETQQSLISKVLNNLDGVVWSLDLKTMTIQYVNSSVEALYGHPPEAFMGAAGLNLWQSLIYVEDRPRVEQLLNQLCDQDRVASEYRIIRADGQMRWVRDCYSVSYAADGTPLRVDGIVTDITAQKQVSEDLGRSEGRLRALFQQMAIGINQAAPDGTYIQVNQAFCRMLGYSEAELLQLRFQDVTYQEDMPETETALAQLYPGKTLSVTLEKRYICKDGRLLWTNVVLSVLRDDRGQVISDIAIVEDISGRKQTEADLQKSEMTRQAMLEAIPDLLMRINRQGMRLDVISGGEVTLWRPKGEPPIPVHPQQPLRDIMPPDLAEQRLQAIGRALETGERQVYEHRIEIDGESRYEETRIVPMNADDVMVMVRDVTAKVKTELRLQALARQLQDANAELNRIASIDALTEVANRRHFDQVLAGTWARAKQDGTPIVLILCDVDYFKPYNDNYGHPAGDCCLQQVAQQIKAAILRPQDLMARYGGEEFVVLLPNTEIAEAMTVVARIQQNLAQAHLIHEFSAVADRITLSFGLTCCVPLEQHTTGDLLAAADVALYQAKLRGRNCHCINAIP